MSDNQPIPTPKQKAEVWRLARAMQAEGKRVCVHWNRCGCCISVHEDRAPERGGYIVGKDGGSDWVNP